jgi:hypothetical protein
MIEGQTNVRSSRFGAGAIDGIGQELGRFLVTTMAVPWQRAQPRIGAQPVAVLLVESMEFEDPRTADGRRARMRHRPRHRRRPSD